MHKGKVTIGGDNRKLAKSYVRHMNLVCMAFEKAVPDPALQAAAKDSNHLWAVALRAAIDSATCPACHGNGKVFMMAPDMVHGSTSRTIPSQRWCAMNWEFAKSATALVPWLEGAVGECFSTVSSRN